MNKTNKKSINYGLKVLAILAFGLIIPFNITSAAYGSNSSGGSYYNSEPIDTMPEVNNPVPSVTSINPKSADGSTGAKTITITGNGFVPNSISRVNGSDRFTTFIDSSHLLIQLNGNDISRADGFFITVFNKAPGGGYSNAAYFTVNSGATSAPVNTVNNNTSSNTTTTQTQNTTSTTSDTSKNYSSLASNAIYGSNSFLPSGLIQWIIFAIIVLLIVILVRKLFGAKQEYEESPMKHA